MHKSVVSLLMFGAVAASGAILPEYPEKPITLLVGYGAGGVGDHRGEPTRRLGHHRHQQSAWREA